MQLRKLIPPQLKPAARLAAGIVDSDARRLYVEELRRRMPLGRKPGSSDTCLVCGSSSVRRRLVSYVHVKKKPKVFSVIICQACGHVANPDNFKDYTEFESLKQFGIAPRVGTEERAGREFHMAQMSAEILDRDELTVLLYGPGRSVDYRRIAKLDSVGKVAIGDIVQLIDDAEWVDLTKPPAEPFDIVVASEVVEHFTDPPKDFEQLLSHVKDDGIVICSTNIHDGSNLNYHNYLFIKGHTSYYSPGAIAHLARSNGVFFDFRLPESATTHAGMRKRYILFTRSAERLQAITQYFGDHTYAPSED